MAYVAMGHQSTGYIVPASDYNQILDNIAYLKGAVSANIWLSGAGMWASVTLGAGSGNSLELGTNKQTLRFGSFADGAYSYLECAIALPADYNGGTLTGVPYWTHPTTTTNFGVVFGLQGRAYANDDALDQAWGTEVTSTDTGGTTSDLYIGPATSALTLAGSPAALQFAQFRTRRIYDNANDTMAVAAYLLGWLLTYTRS